MDSYATHTGLIKCRLDSLHRIHQKIFFHPHPCLHRVLSCPQSPAAACQWGYYPPSSSALGTAPRYWWTRPGQCHKSWTQLGGRGRGGKRLMTYKRCVCVCVDVTLVLQVSCHDQTVQNLAYACAYLVVQISHACKAYTRHRFCNLCTMDLQTWYQGRYVHVCVLHVGMCICCVYESVHTPVLQQLIARQDLLILEGSTSGNDLSLDHYQTNSHNIWLELQHSTSYAPSNVSMYLHLSFLSLSPLTLNSDTPWMNSVKRKRKTAVQVHAPYIHNIELLIIYSGYCKRRQALACLTQDLSQELMRTTEQSWCYWVILHSGVHIMSTIVFCVLCTDYTHSPTSQKRLGVQGYTCTFIKSCTLQQGNCVSPENADLYRTQYILWNMSYVGKKLKTLPQKLVKLVTPRTFKHLLHKPTLEVHFAISIRVQYINYSPH